MKPKLTKNLRDDLRDASLKFGTQIAMCCFVQQVREINSIPRQSKLDPNKPIKELYHEMLDNDPKYK